MQDDYDSAVSRGIREVGSRLRTSGEVAVNAAAETRSRRQETLVARNPCKNPTKHMWLLLIQILKGDMTVCVVDVRS